MGEGFGRNLAVSYREMLRRWKIPIAMITGGFASNTPIIHRKRAAGRSTPHLALEFEICAAKSSSCWVGSTKSTHSGFRKFCFELLLYVHQTLASFPVILPTGDISGVENSSVAAVVNSYLGLRDT